MARLAEGPIAESFADGDRNPPVFDPKTHTVTLPESFKKSVRAMLDGGWDKIGLDEELGGMPMPQRAACGRCTSTSSAPTPRCTCTRWARASRNILYNLGTEEQKKWAVLAAERGWGSRPWCSPSPTPVPTSAPAAPRPSSRTTAPGTSTA